MMPVDGNEDFYEYSFDCHHLTANILIFSSHFGLLGRPMYYPQLLCPRDVTIKQCLCRTAMNKPCPKFRLRM
jgi:hypothetical protein